MAVTVAFVIAGFFLFRFVRRHKPSLLPNYNWLRGKGKGAKGRLGLVGVELLPTSMKSIPAPIPSAHFGVFAGSSNVGKDKDTNSLLSRSSSLEMLPTFNPEPPSTFPIRSPRNPFKFSMFNDHKSKSRSYSHRRSKSLNVPTRHLPGPSSSSPLSASSPPTPSPQALLIDFSTSNSSSSSAEISASSHDSSFSKATTSSDVGTHRFSPDAVVGPLIPIPMPVPSPNRSSTSKPTSTSSGWAYEFDEDGEDDPLMAVFKRSQNQPSSPTPDLVPSSHNIYPQPPTPSTAGFPLTPPPPGLYFDPLDINATWSNKGKDRDISSPLSPSPTDAIELVSITPPSPSPVGIVTKDLEAAPVFPLPFSAARWNGEPTAKEVKLVDLGDEEEHMPPAESGMAGIGRSTFVDIDIDEEPHADLGPIHEDEKGVVDDREAVRGDALLEALLVPVQQEVEHDVDDHKDQKTVQPMDDDESEDEESLSPASSYSRSRSPSPSPQYSPPLGMLHTSPLPISGTNLVDISRSPSPLVMSEPFSAVMVVPPSPRASWSWDADTNADEADDAWGFRTAMDMVEELSTDVRGDGEDLIRFDGNGSDGVRDEDRSHVVEPDQSVPMAVEEEAWFSEEPTVVWNDVVEVEHGVEGGNVLAPVQVEKNLQVLGPVFEENVEPAMRIDAAKEMTVEMESLAPQDEALVHDIRQLESQEKTTVHDSNDVYDILPMTMTTTLEPLLIPSTTMNQEEEEYPDPDLLPLPEQHSQKPSAPTIKIPMQTPTPPTSPPVSPWRLDARSDYSGLTTPTSTPASPFTLHTPIVVSSTSSPIASAQTPSSATRPAWSLRASDAPALGLPAPSANVGVPPRSSPDMRMKMKMLGDVMENEKMVEKDYDELAVKDSHSDKEEKAHNLPLPIPIKLSTSLPGTFPSPEPASKLPLPSSPSSSVSATLPHSDAQSPNPVVTTSDNLPLAPSPRRRTPRSPLDIALAMQLRPGLGLGADPAWMVRFLMSMFGWFAILISGRGDFDTYMYAGGVGSR